MNRQPLFSKYLACSSFLVSGALLTSGLVQLYFSYQENQSALLSIQREKAAGAATRIVQFLWQIERQISGSIQAGPAVARSVLTNGGAITFAVHQTPASTWRR